MPDDLPDDPPDDPPDGLLNVSPIHSIAPISMEKTLGARAAINEPIPARKEIIIKKLKKPGARDESHLNTTIVNTDRIA